MKEYTLLRFISIVIMILLTGCSKYEIYVYKGAPCEGKVFTTSKETILLQHEPYYPNRLDYGFSIYHLEGYKEYRKDRRITFRETINKNYKTYNTYTKEIKLYPTGSTFKFLEFYTKVSSSFEDRSELSYYLVQSLDDNQTIWLYFQDFNPVECNMKLDLEDTYHSENRYQEALIRKTYKGISVDNGYVMPDDFTEDEDLFAVSREYQKKHLIMLQKSIKEQDKKDLYTRIKHNNFGDYYARWLRANHVDINVRYEHNETPLILAVKEKNSQAVDYLLWLGADPTLKDSYGKIAMDYTEKSNSSHIYTSLQMHGAK